MNIGSLISRADFSTLFFRPIRSFLESNRPMGKLRAPFPFHLSLDVLPPRERSSAPGLMRFGLDWVKKMICLSAAKRGMCMAIVYG